MTCGHVFCQDDLWNWFHREPDVDDESDSFDSFNSESDDDSSSEDSAGSDHRAVRHLLARRTSPSAATRAIGSSAQAGLRQSSRLNETTARQSQDLVTVEDDYNTDDPLDDSASDKSPSPVAVRGGFRIQTTRGEQVAAHRATLAANRAATQASAVASVPAVSELQTAANESASNGTRNADHRSQEPPTTGRTPRVPALARPRRKNLVCPQCRTPVSIPPFPIFALRGVSDLLAAQTTGRRAQSIEAEREGNSIVDETWGGLFSRGVR